VGGGIIARYSDNVENKVIEIPNMTTDKTAQIQIYKNNVKTSNWYYVSCLALGDAHCSNSEYYDRVNSKNHSLKETIKPTIKPT